MASHACVREQTFVRLPFAAFSETAGWVGANQACSKPFHLRHCANTQQAPDIVLAYFKQTVETPALVHLSFAKTSQPTLGARLSNTLKSDFIPVHISTDVLLNAAKWRENNRFRAGLVL